MRPKQVEMSSQDRLVSSSTGPEHAIVGPIREVVQSAVAPTNPGGKRIEQPIKVVGTGLHLPRQRRRPRGTVERFGTRPENWRGLYHLYVVEDGEKAASTAAGVKPHRIHVKAGR
jgi:hypothetical protein